MKKSRTTLAFAGGMVTLCTVVAVNTALAQGARTQWDGIYTDAQARRGESLYSGQCAGCHGPDLAGGAAPALTGTEFNSNWSDLPLGQLFDRVRNTMPENNPRTLSRQQTADILAYMLSRGSSPSGASELPTQADALNQIPFAAFKP